MICSETKPKYQKQKKIHWIYIKVKLVDIDDEKFADTFDATYDLYKKYQTIIHKDPPESMSDFKEFLCISPMKVAILFDKIYFVQIYFSFYICSVN